MGIHAYAVHDHRDPTSGVRFDPEKPWLYGEAFIRNRPRAKRGSPLGQTKPRYGRQVKEFALHFLRNAGGFNDGYSRADLVREVLHEALEWENTPCRNTIKAAIKWAEQQFQIELENLPEKGPVPN